MRAKELAAILEMIGFTTYTEYMGYRPAPSKRTDALVAELYDVQVVIILDYVKSRIYVGDVGDFNMAMLSNPQLRDTLHRIATENDKISFGDLGTLPMGSLADPEFDLSIICEGLAPRLKRIMETNFGRR